MDIREACDDIMGEKLASAIIADMGISWCVLAAMTDPRNARRPHACAVIRAWLENEKRADVSQDQDSEVVT